MQKTITAKDDILSVGAGGEGLPLGPHDAWCTVTLSPGWHLTGAPGGSIRECPRPVGSGRPLYHPPLPDLGDTAAGTPLRRRSEEQSPRTEGQFPHDARGEDVFTVAESEESRVAHDGSTNAVTCQGVFQPTVIFVAFRDQWGGC